MIQLDEERKVDLTKVADNLFYALYKSYYPDRPEFLDFIFDRINFLYKNKDSQDVQKLVKVQIKKSRKSH